MTTMKGERQARGRITLDMDRTKVLSFCVFLWIAVIPVSTDNLYPELDVHFTDFLREHGYRGGAVSAMREGRLLVARGYGHDRTGSSISAFSKFPISNVAKSFTAVAILNLVEDGKLKLEDTVFGPQGILDYIEPWKRHSMDRRLNDVTVNHLLHHSGGWDDKQPPLYDPISNEVYLKRGHKVPDIAKEMGKVSPFDPLLPEDLISYVIAKPLHFTPGTEIAYSNIGYLVLGRVVEAVTGSEYRDYIKRIILDRCGMWNTRLEMNHYIEDEDIFDQSGKKKPEASVMDILNPTSIDSTLGWYSNVYDLMRFSRCMFHTKTLLDQKYLDLILAKPASTEDQVDITSWHAFGFRVSDRGAVWQDADPQTDDLILYYRKPSETTNGNLKVTIRIEHSKDSDQQTTEQQPSSSTQIEDIPDSWVVLLSDKSVNHLRHQTREILASVKPSRFLYNQRTVHENIFLYDLSELHRHPSWEPLEAQQAYIPQKWCQITVRYKIDEHHLTAYVNALRAEGFAVNSFTSHTRLQHTFFLVVGKKDFGMGRKDTDFIFEHGMDHRKLLKTKLHMEKMNYNMTLLHSYNSKSHRSHIHSFAALFNYKAYTSDMLMKYGTSHLPEPYEKLVQMYHEQQFYPVSETVIYHHKDERFSFLFIKKLGAEPVDFRQYYNLSAKRLSQITEDHAKMNMGLSYLNAYTVYGKFRFSAVYTNATHNKGVLELEQPTKRATEKTILNLKDGFTPKQMVPYFDDHDKFKIAVYFEEM